ncbi:hypothetical protein [Streptomyces sp. NPDC007264]|uniref:hypothetical protein n=1 Tax=Streptomyces sp. NPDC007264 TaxID=3364777 RepID=UPI0036D845D7
MPTAKRPSSTACWTARSAAGLSSIGKRRVTGRANCCSSRVSRVDTSRSPLATKAVGSATRQVRSAVAPKENASSSLGSSSSSWTGWLPMSTS